MFREYVKMFFSLLRSLSRIQDDRLIKYIPHKHKCRSSDKAALSFFFLQTAPNAVWEEISLSRTEVGGTF